jgi:tellurite resistance protein TehA-like permease
VSGADGPSSAEHSNGVREAVRTLHPGYFALVMATGIMSIAMREHHAHVVSVVMLWLTGIAYIILITLTTVRVIYFRSEYADDLTDPRRGFGMFTFVAATNVFGTRLAVDGHHLIAVCLLALGWLAWLVLGYVVPWTALLGHPDRPGLQAANGTWFIWVVASQSIAVFSWAMGVFLYAAAGLFVAARMLLYPLRPQDLTPPYWVAMGATAITVVAGARIVQMADAPMVAATRGLAAGTSVVFWAFGTWLIPPLIAAGVWRHMVHRIPLRYEATLWSVVFPLGMNGVGAHYLGQADGLPIVERIGYHESWIALAVWAVTFAAMLHHLASTVLSRPGSRAQPSSEGAVGHRRAAG